MLSAATYMFFFLQPETRGFKRIALIYLRAVQEKQQ